MHSVTIAKDFAASVKCYVHRLVIKADISFLVTKSANLISRLSKGTDWHITIITNYFL